MTTIKTIKRAAVWHARFFLLSALMILFLLPGCSGGLPFGGVPRIETRLEPFQNLGNDWKGHFQYGLEMLEGEFLDTHKTVFARAAFSSAARFARDHAPSYVGLGLAELNLGNFSEAQVAFLNAALIDDRSMYWALAAIAALRNGDETVAFTLFHAMQSAIKQDDDLVSQFIRSVYMPSDESYSLPMMSPVVRHAERLADENLICESNSEERVCQDLNIVAKVYFVRRYSSDNVTRGTDFFNELSVKLGAEKTFEWVKPGDSSILTEVSLSVPEIQYAVRLTPQNVNSSFYVNAAPSIITSLGENSEIREGTNLTILYNSEGYTDDFTAEIGMMLSMTPEVATPENVKLRLTFELSSINALEPSQNAQILDVSSNTFTVAGYFPYGKPVVLGTISSGSQKYNSSGQVGFRRLPVVGGFFGKSQDIRVTSDTLVLGILSEPSAFRGSREQRVLAAMRAKGVNSPTEEKIMRRQIIHLAPDLTALVMDFLKQQS